MRIRKYILGIITAGFLVGCMPSDNKSEGEKAIDKEQTEVLVGKWVLESVNGDPVSPDERTKMEFTDKGVANTSYKGNSREGKWAFADSARVLAIQEGSTGDRLDIRSLTNEEFVYAITKDNQEVIIRFVREE